MNQILATETNSQKRKKNYSNLIDMKKIIIIFSVLVLVFGLVIIGAKIYGQAKDKNKKTETPQVALNKPQITIKEEGSGSICVLQVIYDEGLEEVSYWWNEENVRNRSLNGQTEPFVTNIQIPREANSVLHVKAVGSDESISTVDYVVGSQTTSNNSNKIDIQWFYKQESNEINIIAKCEDGLKQLTYQWEGEELQTITSTSENQKELQAVVEAKRGTNKIHISATDLEGNIEIKEQNIIGALQPEIKLILENGELLRITIEHDKGFKQITITINGETAVFDENHPGLQEGITQFEIDVPVKPGQLTVDVSVYTKEQPDYEYRKGGSVTI